MRYGEKKMKKLIKEVIVKTLPVMSGYMILGFGFGVIAEKNGYGILWVLAMSLFIFAGSMQYVTVSLLTSGVSLLTAALTTLMVNARHLFYGISMIEPYRNAGKLKPYMIFGLTDETYSLVCSGQAPDGLNYHKFCFFVSLFNQSYWVMGSVLGAVAGSAMPYDFAGVDFAMTALFLTVFVDQWKHTRNHISAVVGVASSIVCLLLFGSDQFLIPSMLCISVLLISGRNYLEKGEVHP